MNEPQFWYYYLHSNDDLIGKNPAVVDSDPQYFDSPLVQKHWRVDLTDRGSMWIMILEALAKGARIDRVKELAEKWKMDFDDSIEFLKRYRPSKMVRGGMKIFIAKILGMSWDEYFDRLGQMAKEEKE